MPRLQEGQRAVGAILPEQRMRNRLQCTVIRKGHSMTTTTKIAGEAMTKDQIRDIFMAHGFTIKEGQTDLKPYVYDAARALLASERVAREGWKLVPLEPTNKMTAVGQEHRYQSVWSIGAIYREMLAASPTAPAQPCGEDAAEQADEAVTIKVDKDRFDQLMDALDRAESKGYMPDAIAQRWSAFEWEIVPPSRAKDSK